MVRRSDPLRVARAQLEGAERQLRNAESGLLDRDVDACRARVAELERRVASLLTERSDPAGLEPSWEALDLPPTALRRLAPEPPDDGPT